MLNKAFRINTLKVKRLLIFMNISFHAQYRIEYIVSTRGSWVGPLRED